MNKIAIEFLQREVSNLVRLVAGDEEYRKDITRLIDDGFPLVEDWTDSTLDTIQSRISDRKARIDALSAAIDLLEVEDDIR